MIQFPDFSDFRNAVESLGMSVPAEIKRALETGAMDADLENLVVGASGIYSITELERKLWLTKVILHIADYNIQRLDEVGRETARADFYANRFDSIALIRAVHKYHFFFCQTLESMFERDRTHRYKQSHRQDGKFRYAFLSQSRDIVKDRTDQTLYPCGNCMKMFRNATHSQVPVHEFRPSMFFDEIPQLQWLPDCGYELDTQHIPAQYAKNFREIHTKVKKKKNYRCEGEKCGIDLSAPNLQQYADCHHANADITDNNRSVNLKCLCVKCHAEQFQHSHMKQTERYLEFLPIWEENSPS